MNKLDNIIKDENAIRVDFTNKIIQHINRTLFFSSTEKSSNF